MKDTTQGLHEHNLFAGYNIGDLPSVSLISPWGKRWPKPIGASASDNKQLQAIKALEENPLYHVRITPRKRTAPGVKDLPTLHSSWRHSWDCRWSVDTPRELELHRETFEPWAPSTLVRSSFVSKRDSDTLLLTLMFSSLFLMCNDLPLNPSPAKKVENPTRTNACSTSRRRKRFWLWSCFEWFVMSEAEASDERGFAPHPNKSHTKGALLPSVQETPNKTTTTTSERECVCCVISKRKRRRKSALHCHPPPFLWVAYKIARNIHPRVGSIYKIRPLAT